MATNHSTQLLILRPVDKLGRPHGIKHGQACYGKFTRAYRIWSAVMSRCLNPHTQNFKYYGGRGITICEHWRTFTNFFADMGVCPDGLTIERIDNNKDYEPGNCRWATFREQANNSRHNRSLTLHGVTQTLAAWSTAAGLNESTIRRRLDHWGWTVEEALTLPPNGRVRTRDSKGLFTTTND